MIPENDLLDYYRNEIAYLREQGGQFAARYPKVAQRLVLSSSESPDPHTELLLESFAFLTARVQRDIDSEFPAISGALLNSTCPNLVHVVPSLSVAQMTLDPAQGKVTAGLKIPKHTRMWAFASSGETCRFKTVWETQLWPISLSNVSVDDERILRLDFETTGGADLSELALEKLSFHLGGDLQLTMPLHELFVSALESIELIAGDGRVHVLDVQQLKQLGHSLAEIAVPQLRNAHPAYALLQQYFAQPRLFQFFDLEGLLGRFGLGSCFSIRFVFDHSARVLQNLTADNFQLGCVPTVNLFEQTSEPINLTHKEYEYRLVPDFKREESVEIHSIQAVFSTDPKIDRPTEIPHVFAGSTSAGRADVFWTSRQELSLRPGMTGTDTYLSFVNNAQDSLVPETPVVYAKTLCTNRRLAQMVPAGARLVGEGISTSIRIKNKYQPSAQLIPKFDKGALWNLVSILRLNQSSLVDGQMGLSSLQDLLMLFAGESASNQAHVRGIKSLHAKPATMRKGTDVWRGLCSGIDVSIEFDEDAFVGASALLFSRVLAEFLSLYTTVNSFVRVSIYRNGQLWIRWPALGGGQCIL